MNLRLHMALRRPLTRRVALLGILALALVAFGKGPGNAVAGLSDYNATLYLSGAATSTVPAGLGSYKLLPAATAQPASTPVPTVAGAGVLTGTYQYEYTIVDAAGGETPASTASAGQTVSGKSFNINGLPTGVTVRLYRTCSCSSALYYKVAELVPTAASPQFVDNVSDATADVPANLLPLTQNRPTAGAGGIGYYEFVPGVPLTSTIATSAKLPGNPAFSNKGWLIDAPGRVSFPAGNWTFTEKFKGTAGPIGNTAHIVIGMWIVDDTGAVVGSPLIDPTAASSENLVANIATSTGTASPIATTLAVGAISLASNQHLYVQFWRRQTANTSNTTTTLVVNDGVGAITHPTANGYPDPPTLGTVAARTNVTPQLSATFTDPDSADTGTVSFQLCTDSACNTVVQSYTSASGIARNTVVNWTPPTNIAPADHSGDRTYWWRTSSVDSAGNSSGWSSTSSFVVDTIAPTTPTLVSPASAARVNSTQLSATFADTDAGDTGTLNFQLCGDVSCSSPTSGSSSTVAAGSNGSWTPTGIADGTYYWRAQNQDTAGNTSGWSATRSLTLDTTAPTAATLNAVPALVNTPPALSAVFTDADALDTGTVSFQVCSDSGCSTVRPGGSATVANGATGTWTPTGLADGTYYARASVQDAAGNPAAAVWSATQPFTLDSTPPSTPSLGAVAARTTTTPQLSATYSDATSTGTLALQLCSNSTCTRVIQSTSSSSGLASSTTFNWTPANLSEGTYYWRARATDAAGNASEWSAAATFTVDRTPPVAPVTVGETAQRVRTSPVLSARLDDPGDATDTMRMLIQICSDSECADVFSTGYSAAVAAGGVASWQPASLADGTYYWRAAAEDAAGNQSAWSRVWSFAIDTVAPSVPEMTAPTDGTVVNKARMTGTFAGTDVGDAVALNFEVCADEACTTVVASGSSASVRPASAAETAASTSASWAAGALPDGTYFWRACAQDEAGNISPWSPTMSFRLDGTPPGKPRAFVAAASGRVLTLRWQAPAGAEAAGYALLVNGRRTQSFDAQTLVVRIRLRNGDKRSFAVAAFDEAGNLGVSTASYDAGAEPTVKQARTVPKRTPPRPSKSPPTPSERPRRH